jgi:hypothetical protein
VVWQGVAHDCPAVHKLTISAKYCPAVRGTVQQYEALPSSTRHCPAVLCSGACGHAAHSKLHPLCGSPVCPLRTRVHSRLRDHNRSGVLAEVHKRTHSVRGAQRAWHSAKIPSTAQAPGVSADQRCVRHDSSCTDRPSCWGGTCSTHCTVIFHHDWIASSCSGRHKGVRIELLA